METMTGLQWLKNSDIAPGLWEEFVHLYVFICGRCVHPNWQQRSPSVVMKHSSSTPLKVSSGTRPEVHWARSSTLVATAQKQPDWSREWSFYVVIPSCFTVTCCLQWCIFTVSVFGSDSRDHLRPISLTQGTIWTTPESLILGADYINMVKIISPDVRASRLKGYKCNMFDLLGELA